MAESPKRYREQISQKSADLEKATRRLQELESKVADYDKRGLDTKALTEQLEAREKAYEKAMADFPPPSTSGRRSTRRNMTSLF